MVSIEDNVKRVYEKIVSAAERSGRSGSDITLVAASKQNGPENVKAAKEAGVKIFGENRVQELLEKKSTGAYEGAGLHLIGHLQKNKVRNIVGQCDMIQSVDSTSLMEMISKKALQLGICQDILIEVNIGGEESKSGFSPEALDEMTAFASQCPGIMVKGIMAIPPIRENNVQIRNYFDSMYKLYVDIKAKKYDNTDIYVLSMGMSGDYEEAILAGSNMVRIGSAIFGPRKY